MGLDDWSVRGGNRHSQGAGMGKTKESSSMRWLEKRSGWVLVGLVGLIAWVLVASSHRQEPRRSTVPLPLAFSEGVLLRQHTVPVRLPQALRGVSSQASMPKIVAYASAPVLSMTLLHLSRYDPKTLGVASFFPQVYRHLGFFVMLTDGDSTLWYQFPLVNPRQTSANGFAFIGTPSREVKLPSSARHVALGRGLVGSWYTSGPNPTGFPFSYLLTWRERNFTYAIWAQQPEDISLKQVPATVVALAKSMAYAQPITQIERASMSGRYFQNTSNSPRLAGYLVHQSLRLAPPGTSGYPTRAGVGYALKISKTPIPVTPPPDYRSTARHPFPGLSQVLKPLAQVRQIPVLLPRVTPYLNAHSWPALVYQIGRRGYWIQMNQSNAAILPNTPTEMDNYGDALTLGTIAGGNLVSQAGLVSEGPMTAPPIAYAQLMKSGIGWVLKHQRKGVFREQLTLPNGVKAVVADLDLFGSGGMSIVSFRVGGVPYAVSEHLNLNQTLQMAASMTSLSASGAKR